MILQVWFKIFRSRGKRESCYADFVGHRLGWKHEVMIMKDTMQYFSLRLGLTLVESIDDICLF